MEDALLKTDEVGVGERASEVSVEDAEDAQQCLSKLYCDLLGGQVIEGTERI